MQCAEYQGGEQDADVRVPGPVHQERLQCSLEEELLADACQDGEHQDVGYEVPAAALRGHDFEDVVGGLLQVAHELGHSPFLRHDVLVEGRQHAHHRKQRHGEDEHHVDHRLFGNTVGGVVAEPAAVLTVGEQQRGHEESPDSRQRLGDADGGHGVGGLHHIRRVIDQRHKQGPQRREDKHPAEHEQCQYNQLQPVGFLFQSHAIGFRSFFLRKAVRSRIS